MRLATRFAISFIALAFVTTANAQDVYNFYFQKSDHATEMVQVKNGEATKPVTETPMKIESGGAPSVAPVSAPASVAPSMTTTVTSTAPTEGKKSYWRLELGLGAFADHVLRMQNGLALNVQAAINKYFAFEAQVMGGKGDWGDNNSSSTPVKNYFAGSAGVLVTPVHIEFFGYDFIDLSIAGGVMSTNGREGSYSAATRITSFYGGGVSLNLSEKLSVNAEIKVEDTERKGRFGQTVAGLSYKF